MKYTFHLIQCPDTDFDPTVFRIQLQLNQTHSTQVTPQVHRHNINHHHHHHDSWQPRQEC